MHCARINRSKRLQVILECLKRAPHPLSSEDIARMAYDFSRSNRIMLNVSTNLHEMRSEENRADGYTVSHADTWNGKKYQWHDGNPRYWLEAAPGWRPSWSVTPDGDLIHYGSSRNAQPREEPGTDSTRICSREGCGNPVPIERAREMYMTCSDACSEAWRKSIRPAFTKSEPQGSLL